MIALTCLQRSNADPIRSACRDVNSMRLSSAILPLSVLLIEKRETMTCGAGSYSMAAWFVRNRPLRSTNMFAANQMPALRALVNQPYATLCCAAALASLDELHVHAVNVRSRLKIGQTCRRAPDETSTDAGLIPQ